MVPPCTHRTAQHMEHLGFSSLASTFSLGCLSGEHKTPLIRPGTAQDITHQELKIVTFRGGRTFNTSLQYLLTASTASIYHQDLDFLRSQQGAENLSVVQQSEIKRLKDSFCQENASVKHLKVSWFHCCAAKIPAEASKFPFTPR